MGRLHRLIVAVSLTLLAAGAFGAIIHATRPAPSGGGTAAAPAAPAARRRRSRLPLTGPERPGRATTSCRRRAWGGQFTYAGSPLEIQVGLVLQGHEVLGLVWIDSVPDADPVMGSFASTLSLAIGKLA